VIYCLCFQEEDGIRDRDGTGVQTCALPIFKVNVGSVDQITTATVTFELTTNSAGVGIVEVLAP